MNAQKIWRGSDYAMGYKRKGATNYPVNAERVKIVDIIKEPVYGRTKDRTYLKVMILGDDGMPTTTPPTLKSGVVARDIIAHWDEYIETVEDEREEYFERQRQLKIEREEAHKRREEESAVYTIGQFLRRTVQRWEYEDKERERKAAEERKKQRELRLKNVMIGRGFKPEGFWLTGEQVCIKFDELERWFGFK